MALFDRLKQKLTQLVDDHLTVPEAVRQELSDGKQALESGDVQRAQELLGRVTEVVPDQATAWFLLGVSQLRQGDAPEACESLERAAKLRGEDLSILVTLAEAQRNADRAELALDSYKRALRCQAGEQLLEQVYGGMGQIFLDRGQWRHAVRELRKAVALSEEKDLHLVGLLGIARRRTGALALARQSLSMAAAAVPASRAVLQNLVEVLLELDHVEEARLAAVRWVQDLPEDPEARGLLARCLLAAGQHTAALQELMHALQGDPRRYQTHILLARVYDGARDHNAALRHLRLAGDLTPPTQQAEAERLERLLTLQLEQAPPSPVPAAPTRPGPGPGEAPREQPLQRLEEDARALLELRPEDPLALAALSVTSLEQVGQEPRALDLAIRSLRSRPAYAGHLALGMSHAARGELTSAAAAFRAAARLRPGSDRARELLTQVYRSLGRVADGGAERPLQLYSALRRVHRLLQADPQLADLSVEVARVQEVFDSPLLVTVMGEFNSGKSTFVNALVGEEVAPMGVTPTTATINILKYGARKAARVLWQDDREEEVKWAEVGSFLRGLDPDRASKVRFVELLYPSEELLRVNVVDTPGLNSMIDAHEQTARDYMGRSDAVIWLFSAFQAGKQTEQEALELLGKHRLKTVGVLNKADRLDEQELEQILEHLEHSFEGLVEWVVPVSARQALAGQVQGAEDLLEQSRFPALRQLLERQIFARSRRIKRQVCVMRLEEVLEEGSQRLQRSTSRLDLSLEQLDALLSQLGEGEGVDLLREEGERINASVQQVFEGAANEVLDFVRPRRWAFGEHQVSAADRDFLLSLLLSGVEQVSEDSLERVDAEVVRVWEEHRPRIEEALGGAALPGREPWLSSLDQLIDQQRSLLEKQVYSRYCVYARGWLQGGKVDRFIEQRLPGIALDRGSILEALEECGVDLEEELLAPLAEWYGQTRSSLVARVRGIRHEVDLARLEQDQRLLCPLVACQARLEQVDHEPATEERQ